MIFTHVYLTVYHQSLLFQSMYVKYVQNAKFVSADTLPGINFMKQSLVEIYLLNHNLSYNHAFLYIRQLAIQLRNAVTLKKQVIIARLLQ
jgi:nucleolar complex protein 2